MFDDQQHEILKQPIIVRISTITKDGYPHTVPVWSMLDGEDLIVFGDRTALKARNVLANPKGSIAIGGDPVGSPCLLVEGDITVEDDSDHSVTSRITHHYEPPAKAQEWLDAWKNDDLVVLRLKPTRIRRIS